MRLDGVAFHRLFRERKSQVPDREREPRLGRMHEIGQHVADVQAAAAQAVEGDLREDEKRAVIGMGVLGGGQDDVRGPPLGDLLADGFERPFIPGHEQWRHALIRPTEKMRLRRLPDAEDGQRIERLLPPLRPPAPPGSGIEKDAPLHDPLRPRIAVAIGQENEPHLRAGGDRLLHQTTAAERLVVGVRSEEQDAIRALEKKSARHRVRASSAGR